MQNAPVKMKDLPPKATVPTSRWLGCVHTVCGAPPPHALPSAPQMPTSCCKCPFQGIALGESLPLTQQGLLSEKQRSWLMKGTEVEP